MTEIQSGEQWYTAEQVAARLRVSPRFVRDKRKTGAIKAKRVSNAGHGRYLYSESAIAEFMESLPDS